MDHLLSNNLNPPHPFDRRRCLLVLCGVVSASAAAGLDHEPRTAAHKQDMVQYCPVDLVSGGSALSSALSCHPCQVCEARWWWHGNLWSRASGSWRRSDGRASPSVPRLDAASRRPLQTLISSTCRRCKHVPMDICSKISGMSVTRPDSPQVRVPGRYQARKHQGHRKGKEQNEVKI